MQYPPSFYIHSKLLTICHFLFESGNLTFISQLMKLCIMIPVPGFNPLLRVTFLRIPFIFQSYNGRSFVLSIRNWFIASCASGRMWEKCFGANILDISLYISLEGCEVHTTLKLNMDIRYLGWT